MYWQRCDRPARRLLRLRVSSVVLTMVLLLAVLLGPFRASAHLCGPGKIVLGVGDLRYYWITADVVEFQPSLYWIAFPGDESVAYVPTGVFSEYFFGFYPIQGLKPGTTTFVPEWAYPINSATGYCTFQVTVSTNPPMTAANYSMSAFAGDPNNAFTGEHIETQGPIFDLKGPMPLRLDLYYASGLSQNLLLQSSLGVNWSHNFDTRIVRLSNRVDVVTYQGLKLQFQLNGTTWQSLNPQAGGFELIFSGNNLVMGDRRQGRLYTFDSFGELISIADSKGNVQTLTYSNNVLTQVTDGLGRVLNFQYFGFQLLYSVDDGTRTVYFDVDPSNNTLSDVFDAMGGLTAYTYDASNPVLLTAKTLPNGNTPVSLTYDSNGRVIQQVDLDSFTNWFSYANGLTVVTNPLGKTKIYGHTANGQLTNYVDEANRGVSIQSNTNGQRTLLTDRLGKMTGLAYDPVSHKVAAVTNADGSVIRFSYSSRVTGGITFFDLSQISYSDSTTEQFTYDSLGNVISRRNRTGQTWSYTYNGHGQILAERNPLGGVTELTYNPDGTLASSSDSDLGATTYTYDGLRRLIKITQADGTSRQFVYDALDRLIISTDERTNSYQFAYDSNGNVTNITDPNSAHLQFAYDDFDRLMMRTDRLGASDSFAYDALGNLSAVTNRNGEVCLFTYDALGRPIGFVDAGGNTWSLTANAENMASGLADPLDDATHQSFDAVGNVTGITNPLGAVSSIMRNASREAVQHIDELLRKDDFAYDAAGRLTNLTVPRLGSMSIQRNPLGAPIQVTDFNGAAWSFGSTAMGRPNSFGDPLAWFTYSTYNPRGQVASTVFANGVTLSNRYDPAGNLMHALYSDGTHLDYGYDALNNTISANGVALSRDAEGRITNSSSWGFNSGATYDRLGRLSGISYPIPSLTVSYAYDRYNRLTSISDSLTGSYLKYNYDFGGRRTNILRSNGINGTCAYNFAGEPIHLQEGSYFDWRINRDPAGQPSQIIWNDPADPAATITPGSVFHNYNLGSQISDPGFKWDWQGRLMLAPGRVNSYDGASRLKLSNGTSFEFDGFNNVIASATAGKTNWFLYNHAFRPGAVLAGVYNVNAGVYTTAVVNDPQGVPLWSIDLLNNNKVSFYHFDPNGSVAGITDGTGGLTDKFSYSPLGSFTHIGSNSIYFSFKAALGWKYDEGASLYHSGGRFYDYSLGVHYTPDLSWPRPSEPKANLYGLDTSYRLNFAQFQYQAPRESDVLGSHFSVPVVNEFNIRDYLRHQNPEDSFGFSSPSAGIRRGLDLIRLPSRYGDCCDCCCCDCCYCDCYCCDCCCCEYESPSRLNVSIYLRGGLYSPLTTAWVSRGLTPSEAFYKFFRALVLGSTSATANRGLNTLGGGGYNSGANSWNSLRTPLFNPSPYSSMRSGFRLMDGPRAPNENFRSLLNLHLDPR